MRCTPRTQVRICILRLASRLRDQPAPQRWRPRCLGKFRRAVSTISQAGGPVRLAAALKCARLISRAEQPAPVQ